MDLAGGSACAPSVAAVRVGAMHPLDVDTALTIAFGERVLPAAAGPDGKKGSVPHKKALAAAEEAAAEFRYFEEESDSDGAAAGDGEIVIDKIEEAGNGDDAKPAKQAKPPRKPLRHDSSLWFVPDHHPIEVVGMSASPETRQIFCSVKIDDPSRPCVVMPAAPAAAGDESSGTSGAAPPVRARGGPRQPKRPAWNSKRQLAADAESTEEAPRPTRVVVIPLDVMRERYPQLMIDYLMARAVFQK